MPGILGFSESPRRGDPEIRAVLERMAGPLRYSTGQSAEYVLTHRFTAGAVDHGVGFEFLKPAVAQQDGVLVLLDGEVYAEPGDVPPELRGENPSIQRAHYCLHLYLKFGPDCIKRLNGTFGIAIIDTRDGCIHLATDRFGHNLLFYWSRGQNCAFSTSLRSLLLYREDIGRTRDLRALAELILFERVLGDRTLFTDIKRLPAGCRATWSMTGWEVTRYFTPRCARTSDGPGSWQEAAEELTRRLRHSLDMRLADGAKTGLLLSGGLDSRLVLGCMSSPVSAVTFSHPGHVPKEAKVASVLARAADVPLLLLERSPDHYARIAQRASEVNEGLATFIGCHTIGAHELMRQEGIRVVLTGDRSDVGFKAYFNGVIDGEGISPWTGSPLQTRRAARKLMSSPVVRRAERQDLMMLALSDSMKLEGAAAWEKKLKQLQGMFTHGSSMEHTLCEMALCDWQSFTSMGLVRGLSTEFVDRSPFYDNGVWDLALSLEPEWRLQDRIVRRAIALVSSRLASVPDVSTGIPPRISWPWDGYYASLRQTIRNLGKRCSRYSRTLAALRSPPSGTQLLSSSGYHDRNAALQQCAEYRELVLSSISHLPAEYFDLAHIRGILEGDLAAVAPSHAGLFEILITFAEFDKKWGVGSSRSVPAPRAGNHPSSEAPLPVSQPAGNS